jgi:hypothetical protein
MEEQNPAEWQAPPPPEKIAALEEAQMSEVAMIGNVFIEPGRVFEDQRRKPRFLLGGLLMVLLISVFQIGFVEKFGFENIVRSRIESSKRTANLDSDQKNKIIEQQGSNIAKYVTYGITPVVIIVVFLLGGLLYWLGGNAVGGTGTFFGGVAVWIYSSLAPAIVFTIANVIVMFLKDPDTIDLATSQGGLVKANLSILVDAKASPVLGALLGSVDLFGIWGWALAAIGLQKVAKISSGAAWAVVLIIGLIGVTAKVVGALFF